MKVFEETTKSPSFNYYMNFFIYENIVTLTLLFFSTKIVARNYFVQLKQKQESEQKRFMQKSFLFQVIVEKKNEKTKKYLELSCFICTRIEKLIQLELN